MPLIDVMFTTLRLRSSPTRSRNSGKAARQSRNAALRLTSSTTPHCSSVIRCAIASRVIPALWTSTSRRRQRSPIVATSSAAPPGTARSTTAASPVPPSATTLPATSSAGAVSTSLTTTVAPSAARRRAIAAPMPRPAPVTAATRPSSPLIGSEAAPEAVGLGDDVAGHLVGDRADAVEAAVAPVALHVRLERVAHPAEHLQAEVGGLAGVLGGDHLGHRRLDPARLALLLQRRRRVGDQLCLLLPHRDVGDVVLQDLHLADRLAEGAALLEIVDRILEHSVDDPGAQRGDHDPLVVQCL